MRIKEIVVKKLFGLFDHTIPLHLADRITIMYGPNGIGKTFLLKIINAIFAGHYHVLRQIPFSELTIEFDDKSKLKLKKAEQYIERSSVDNKDHIHIPTRMRKNELIFEFNGYRSTVQSYTVKPQIRQERDFPLSMLDREISDLERVAQDAWLYLPTQEILKLDEVLDRFGDRLPHAKAKASEPDWLREVKRSIPVRFIETQRLLNFSFSRRSRQFELPTFELRTMVPAVVNYSEELANAIQAKLAEYATLSQSLDRTFPTRLVRSDSSNITLEKLKANLKALEAKRSQLMAAGLLDKEKEIDLDLKKINDTNMNVLSVYTEDVGKKLSVFDELTNKIDLLVKIINSRFLYKKMTIDKKKGFIFKTADDMTL